MAKFFNVISHQSMTKINIYHYNYQGNVRKYKQYQIHDMYSHGSSNTVIRRDDTWSTFINMHSSVLLQWKTKNYSVMPVHLNHVIFCENNSAHLISEQKSNWWPSLIA